MRLNLQSDYALRLLMHLAVNRGELCTIADIAARYGISKNHLMKVAHVLGQEGFIETLRGRAGGLRLALPPGEILVGDVVRHTEVDFAVVECLQSDGGACLVTPACRLKSVLREAMEAFLSVLDGYSLDDLVRRNPALRRLLQGEAA